MSGQQGASSRSDAAANRAALIAAAREVFAEHGFGVPLEQIAERGGVSRTTLHRHFPSREHLAAVVIEDNIQQIELRAAELADQEGGVRELLAFVMDLQRRTQALLPVLERGDSQLIADLHRRTADAFAPLVTSAVSDGILRADITVEKVLLAILMVSATVTARDPAERARTQQLAWSLVERTLFS